MLREQSQSPAVPGLDAARAAPVYVVGYRGSPHAQDYREFLERNAVPHDWIDVEHDPLARFLGAPTDVEGVRLPVFLFPDGSRLEPFADENDELAFARTRAELAERVGLHARPSLDLYDVGIAGAGPAGLTAALYAASEGLSDDRRRAPRAGRPGGHERADRELPGLPERSRAVRLSPRPRTSRRCASAPRS